MMNLLKEMKGKIWQKRDLLERPTIFSGGLFDEVVMIYFRCHFQDEVD